MWWMDVENNIAQGPGRHAGGWTLVGGSTGVADSRLVLWVDSSKRVAVAVGVQIWTAVLTVDYATEGCLLCFARVNSVFPGRINGGSE